MGCPGHLQAIGRESGPRLPLHYALFDQDQGSLEYRQAIVGRRPQLTKSGRSQNGGRGQEIGIVGVEDAALRSDSTTRFDPSGRLAKRSVASRFGRG